MLSALIEIALQIAMNFLVALKSQNMEKTSCAIIDSNEAIA